MLYSLSPEWNDSDSVFVLANEFNGLRISAAEVQQANSWQERNGSREQKGYPKKKRPAPRIVSWFSSICDTSWILLAFVQAMLPMPKACPVTLVGLDRLGYLGVGLALQ